MKNGFQFLTDESGKKTSVLIDLKKHGRLGQDMYDAFLAESRKNEPRESLDSVRKRLRGKQSVNGKV